MIILVAFDKETGVQSLCSISSNAIHYLHSQTASSTKARCFQAAFFFRFIPDMMQEPGHDHTMAFNAYTLG